MRVKISNSKKGLTMNRILCVVICLMSVTFFNICTASPGTIVQKSDDRVKECPSNSQSVVITYPIYDEIGPGFGPNKPGDKPILGYAMREACFSMKPQSRIVAWQYQIGYAFAYEDGVGKENHAELLTDYYAGILNPAFNTIKEGKVILPNGKLSIYPIDVYYRISDK